MACHATGAAGAPKVGDAAAWAPRIAQGMDTLVQHSINGLRAMPPRGTCANCSDEDLKAAVTYMVERSQ
jgi:cytochrome c5